jgi:hypothetical protein
MPADAPDTPQPDKSPPDQAPREGAEAASASTGPSWGAMSERHWSKTRKDSNREALDYYRERSKAPGVAEGGAERNFYCMRCDGVIPFETKAVTCPHCGEALDEHVKRYFNWVEIGEPPASDFLPLLKVAALGFGALLVLVVLVWWWWS